MGQGELNNALEQLARDLGEAEIEYMLIGAVALTAHGYSRFTIDLDVVMTAEGLKRFQENLVGRGYRPAFEGARKKYRTTDGNIPVEIILAGEYPGDGKPKPVRFPAPREASIEIAGVRVVTLEKLVELKLASGMTAADRLKDLADVQELIKILRLDEDFAVRLDSFVRDEFLRLQGAVKRARESDREI